MLFLLFSCYSQQNEINFYTYGSAGHDHLSEIIPTNNGYLLCGTTSSFGRISDVYLVKIDSLFNYEWSKTYGTESIEWARTAKKISDNNIIVAGYSNASGNYDGYVLKVDSSGELLRSKSFGGNDWDFFYSMDITFNNEFVFAGETYSYGNGKNDVYLVRTDSAMNILWQKTFGGAGSDFAKSVKQTSDSGFVLIGGTVNSNDTNIFIVKTNSIGDTLWTKVFGDSAYNCGSDIIQTGSNEYVVLASSRTNNNLDIYLFKINNSETAWERYWGYADNDEGFNIKMLPFNRIAISGYTNVFAEKDCYFLTLDTTGLAHRSSVYWGNYSETCFTSLFDGRHIAGGTTASFGAGMNDMFVVKADTFIYPYTKLITEYTDTSAVQITGMNQLEDEKIVIYPNPSSGMFNVKWLMVDGKNTMKIFNILGEIVYSPPLAISHYPLSIQTNLPPGIYFLTIFDEEKVFRTEKIIITE